MNVCDRGVEQSPPSGGGGPGDVRGDATILRAQQRMVGRRRLGGEDVQPGPGDLPGVEGRGQRRFVDQRPAPGVY